MTHLRISRNLILMDSMKIQAITSALYRVTERMDSSEPLKWHLRENALRLSELCSLDQENLSFKEEQERDRLLSEMTRMLKLASSLSYVSKINFDTLAREYTPLLSTKKVEPKNDSLSLEEARPQDVFVPRKEEKEVKKISEEKEIDVPKKDVSEEDGLIKKEDRETVTSRQKKILEHLEGTENSSISDLAVLFADSISEKTIQRDLVDLMVHGLVRAEGDKRWRRYFAVRD